jgi:glycosyltransferase involved in cell wall biosynthesis
MNSPLISVITPTFNRAHLLGDTIESVLQQTYAQWEMIIVDDGSTDLTAELVASYNDPRIRFYAFDHSGNYAVVRNRGLSHSQGDIVAFLDSDDTWSPQKLSRVVETFAEHALSKFILNNVHLVGNTTVKSPAFPDRHGSLLFNDLIQEKNIVFYPSAMVFRKEILSSLPPPNERLPTGADHDFILRMASRFPGSFINERLTSIRKHDSNSSSHGLVQIYSDSVGHVKRFHESGDLTKRDYIRLTAGYYYKLGLILLRTGDKRSTVYFRESINVQPIKVKAWVRYVQSLFQ